jgi:hypothetical protein
MVAGADEQMKSRERDPRGPASRLRPRRLSLVRAAPPPRVLLLGPVDLQHADGPVEVNGRPRLLELAAYLALFPGRDRACLDEVMWPGQRVGMAERRALFGGLRRWLGHDPQGEPYVLPYRSDRGCRLHPEVTTDWALWRLLLACRPTAATEDLEAALALVRGRPFEGTAPARYAWAEALMATMAATVADAARELAERYLARGDRVLADQAAAIGRRADPGHQGLARLSRRLGP